MNNNSLIESLAICCTLSNGPEGARGNFHPPRFKIERRQMRLITGPDAGSAAPAPAAAAHLEMNLHLGPRRQYLPAKMLSNVFLQSVIRCIAVGNYKIHHKLSKY